MTIRLGPLAPLLTSFLGAGLLLAACSGSDDAASPGSGTGGTATGTGGAAAGSAVG